MGITQYLNEARFTELLIKNNAFGDHIFKEWIFYPGMIFGSTDKWWDGGRRDKPHEGLDFCFYCDQENKTLRLTENIKIPAIFDGIIVRIIDDFLGKTIIIEHTLPGSNDTTLCTIYGHVIPDGSADVGSFVKQGEVIATLAGKGKSKAKVLPHLHISLGYASGVISRDKLDWNTISDPEIFTLIDPITIIKSKYRVDRWQHRSSKWQIWGI